MEAEYLDKEKAISHFTNIYKRLDEYVKAGRNTYSVLAEAAAKRDAFEHVVFILRSGGLDVKDVSQQE